MLVSGSGHAARLPAHSPERPMSNPTATQLFTTADFERRRQGRETANEKIVSWGVIAINTIMLGVEEAWSLLVSIGFGNYKGEFEVPMTVRWATTVIVVGHACLLLFLWLQPRYFPQRKYLIVVMRMVMLGGLCWGEWYSPRPDFGLAVPIGGYLLAVVLAGLSYSRGTVLLAGVLAIISFSTVSLLGPDTPLNFRASAVATQLILAVTLVTWHIVSTMLRMTGEAVSNERLSRFFSPEVAERISTDSEVAVRAAECQVTVLFSDISGFTAMSSQMQPQEVVDLLNAYFPRMVDIVFLHGGTLEKFIGDALLAVWGAPEGRHDDADRAVAAAIQMQAELERFNAARAAEGKPPLRVHIGIASGLAAAGYIGTDRYIQYAVIGDTTNVASRICSAAGPGEILVGDGTRSRTSPARFQFEAVPPVAAKGKDQAVVVHRVRYSVAAGSAALPEAHVSR